MRNLFKLLTGPVLGLLLLLPTLSGRAQAVVKVNIVHKSEESNFIVYRSDVPLQIRDFKASPDHGSKGVAATYSGIQMAMSASSEEGRMKIEVSLLVYFDKDRSWMKPQGRNDRVLAHEQLHFDITALYACILKARMEAMQLSEDKAFEQLKQEHRRQMQLLEKTQHSYDRETKHGLDEAAQARWAGNIAKRIGEQPCWGAIF